MAKATAELADLIAAAAAEYGFDASKVWAAGFSNGANTAVALLHQHPAVLNGAVAFSVTKALAEPIDPVSDLAGKKIFIANGQIDPHAPIAVARQLAEQLKGLGATVQFVEHAEGHTILMPHLRQAIAFIN